MADITKIDAFIQSSPHPTWLTTAEGHCVYANPALERLTGFNSDQINQADWCTFLVEEDRAVASASWQRSLATGTPYRVQVRMRGNDGPPGWVEVTAFGHKAGDGSELWVFTGLDLNDVSSQKRTQIKTKKKKKKKKKKTKKKKKKKKSSFFFFSPSNLFFLFSFPDHSLS